MNTTLIEIEPEARNVHEPRAQRPSGPSRSGLLVTAAAMLVLVVAAFLAGWLPRMRTLHAVEADSHYVSSRLPIVTVMPARRAAAEEELTLPANIQAVTEAPILARADGYLVRRYVDIGDHVKAGQVLADIEAPELDQQVEQAKATVLQLQATVEQARASEEQGKVQQDLARVTAQRFGTLLAKGAVSRQENDQYQTQFLAQSTNVQALNRAGAAAHQSLAAAQANLARLTQIQSYKQVRAPFAGVVTLRNVDVGALISTGQTLLFRVAQTDRMRAFVNVPQSESDNVRAGQPASLRLQDSPEEFIGRIVRTANALDPSSRTLLAEVEVPNAKGTLMPGVYGQVAIRHRNANPPIVIPGGTLVIGPQGTQVAVVGRDGTVEIKHVQVARDLGQTVEVASGLNEGDLCINNPDDEVRPGVRVEARRAETSHAQ